MAGFFYFAPTAAQPTRDMVRAWGLEYAFRDNAELQCVQAAGQTPSKSNGYLIADPRRHAGHVIKVALDEQVWRKIPGRGGSQEVWVGYWKDAPPVPGDLLRPTPLGHEEERAAPIDGYIVSLADGRRWQIPEIRQFDVVSERPVPALPSYFELDDSGTLVDGAILDVHQWLWDATEDAWQAMATGRDLTESDALAKLAQIMSANYAVDVIELITMRCFSKQLPPTAVLALALDYRTWRDWAASKKKTGFLSTANGSATSAGAPASPPSTLQLAPIS